MRSHVRSLLLSALAAFAAFTLGVLPASRADEPPPAAKPPVAGITEFTITDATPLAVVLKNLAQLTGATITWSEHDKVISTKKMMGTGTTLHGTVEQIFDAVRAMLANDEVVLTRYGPAESPMYLAMDARTLASQFIMKPQPEVIEITDAMLPKLSSQGGRFVSATIRVSQLTELRDARAALQRVITQNNIGSVQEVPSARAFLVTDFAPNVAVIYRMIRQLDVAPTPVPTTEATKMSPAYFVLKHASARRVAVVLGELFPPKPVRPAVPAAAAGTAAAPPTDSSPRISAEEETNQVIVIANAEDIATMREIVQHVDVEPAK